MTRFTDIRGQIPVAIVGMACRAPGGVFSPAELWQLLLDKRDAVTGSDPGPRWRADEQVTPADLADPRPLRSGSFLDRIDEFDPGFFGVPVREGSTVDPQHRLLMETSWEALEDAGIPPRSLAGSKTGVFIGISNNDYAKRFTLAEVGIYHGISAILSGAPGRISYILDVNGPCVALDGACASSLIAVHLACRSLHDGECDLALAGGATVQLAWAGIVGFARFGALSALGRCAAFDAHADGFVRGEGCGMVALKRLPDAQRDGDRILAVIAGTAINHAGRSRGITQPSRAAQRAVLAAAVRTAGISPGDVGYVEAHATGTRVGDPIEFAALAEVYGGADTPCALGALKTNIGHPESAAGVLGLIKAVLAVRTGVIPANLHFTRWNPDIHADGTRFFVPTEEVAWVGRTHRCAGVSAFGVTGANAHLIVVQAPPQPAPPHRPPRRRLQVYPVSAASPRGLANTCARLAEHLVRTRPPVADVGHTLATRRSHLAVRACVVAAGADELLAGLRALADGRPEAGTVSGPTLAAAMPVWVFSGHGSQWPGMGRDLLDRDPAFTRMIDRLDAAAAATGFSIRRSLTDRLDSDRMDVVQPLLFAVQIALAEMWRAWGLRPAAVVGHSMGEAAAAVAAGMLSPEDGLRITTVRSALLQRVAGGCMTSVALPVDQVAAEIAEVPGVCVAVVTAPASTVIGGDVAGIREMVRRWERRGVFCKQIAVVVAAHSPQVAPILDDLAEQVSWLAPAPAAAPFYSTALPPGQPVVFDAAYWVRNLRSPVRFDLACAAILADGHRLFLEMSPHPLLTQAVEDTAASVGAAVVTVASLRRGSAGRESMCRAAAELHVAGVPVDLDAANGGGALTALPPTAFDRARYWEEESPDDAGRSAWHMWLGPRLAVPDPDTADRTRHVWKADLGTDRVGWLAQHTLYDDPVVPGAAYLELVLAAATDLLDHPIGELRLTDVRFDRLLPLAAAVPVQVSAANLGGQWRVEVSRQSGGGWETIAAATVTRPVDAAVPVPPLDPPAPETGLPEGFYEHFAAVGLDVGPAFRSIVAATDDGLTRLRVPDEAEVRSSAPRVHPVLIDGCILSVSVGLPQEKDPRSGRGRAWLPHRIASVVLPTDPSRIVWTRCAVNVDGAGTATGRADLYDHTGEWVGALDGISFVQTGGASPLQLLNSRLFEIAWREAPLPIDQPESASDAQPADRAEPTPAWALVAEPDDPHQTADRLAEVLVRSGAQATVVHLDPDSDGTVPPTVPADARQVAWCATGRLGGLDRVTRVALLLRGQAEGGVPRRLWLVSRCARPVGEGTRVDPDVCALRGLLRIASFEQPDAAVTWVDADEDPTGAGVELLAGTPETEVAWRTGKRYVARMVRAPLADRPPATEAEELEAVAGTDDYVLHRDPDGALDRMHLAATGQPLPAPGPDQVLIRVLGCAVHFRDVMVALGIYPTADDRLPGVGVDATGVVVAVGNRVDNVRPGDTVAVVVPDGSGTMRSHCLADADTTVPLPDHLDPVRAASVPITYATARYCLHRAARLAAGETVLVHSAAGGVGLAAAAVARLLGATVIGTAGTETKRCHLRDIGVAHVFDSRSLDFANRVREVTGGRGVDVVLNSLTGAAMRASLELLAPGGRFVEIGKRDLYAGTRIDLGLLRRDNTYAAVDLAVSALVDHEAFREAVHWGVAQVAQGRLPVLPTTVYPVSDAAGAFKQLATGDQVGRIVLRFPDPGQPVRVHAPTRVNAVVRPEAAYIVTGGTRGLGVEAARWLAEAGAGRVVLGGRREPPPAAARVLAEVRATGCAVELVRGDIADPDTVRRLVAAAGPDLRGVLHTAVVLDDTPLTGLTPPRLATVWHPKVTGARHLHEATRESGLDWFVIFSSMAAMLGNPGQASYAAAGSWVDAFAEWRSRQGLPTLSVDWGAWGEAGRATDLAERGFHTIGTVEGFQALARLLEHRRVNTGIFSYQPDLMFRAFPHAAEAPLLVELVSNAVRPQTGPDAETIRRQPRGPARVQLVQELVIRHLAALLGTDPAAVPPHASFTDIGLDSLLAVALTRRLQPVLEILLPPGAVWAHPTPIRLARHIDSQLAG